VNLDHFYYLLLWSFIADIVMNLYFQRDPDISEFKNYYFISGIPLLIAIPWAYDKKLLTALGVVLCLIISVNSGYRTVFVITCATVLMGWILTAYLNFKSNHKIKTLVSLTIGFFVIFIIYINIESLIEIISAYIMNKSPGLFNQLIHKSTLLIEGSSKSDDLRVAYISHIFKYWYRYLVPYGLGYSTTIDNIESFNEEFWFGGNTLDNTYFWMVYHYGIIVAFSLMTCFFIKITKIVLALQKSKIHLVVTIYFFPFMLSNYTLSFFSIPFHALFTSIILGIIFKIAPIKFINKNKLLTKSEHA